MNREHVLYTLFALLALIVGLHFIGLDRFWYWSYWWFDLVTHFLFGLWVGLFALWGLFLSGYVGAVSFTRTKALIAALVVVGAVGIAWEIFEVWAGVPIKEGHALDTTLDLVMDLSGAMAGYFGFLLCRRPHGTPF